MTVSAAMTLMLKAFAVFSVLLLVGAFLRAKVKVFQALYLPACVIGGFLGLIVGPNVLNVIPFPEELMSAASSLPGVLIVPVLAAVPMCMQPAGGKGLTKQKDIITIFSILTGGCFLQFVVGLLVNVGCRAAGGEAYATFGLELPFGFCGGHGMAGSLGSALKDLNAPYWEVAQGVASTSATVGLVGAIVVGVILINMAARRGYTTVVKTGEAISKEVRRGYYGPDGEERPSLGVQTTVPNSIETLTLHLALLFAASGGAYILSGWVGKLGIGILSAMATWFYAMILMAVFWCIIRACRIEYLFDETVKNKITGFLSDYIIVAAIMSIPVDLVMTYWLPMLIMFALGILVTVLVCYGIGRRFLREFWFEKILGPLGSNMGVYVSGMLLTKMADPELKTPALKDYALGYTLASFVNTPLMALLISVTFTRGVLTGALLSLGIAAVCFVPMIVFCRRQAV